MSESSIDIANSMTVRSHLAVKDVDMDASVSTSAKTDQAVGDVGLDASAPTMHLAIMAAAARASDLTAQDESNTREELASDGKNRKSISTPTPRKQTASIKTKVFTDEQKQVLLERKKQAIASGTRVSWKKLSQLEQFQGFTKIRLKNTADGLWREHLTIQERAAKRERKQAEMASSIVSDALNKAQEAERELRRVQDDYEKEIYDLRKRQAEDKERYDKEIQQLYEDLEKTNLDWQSNQIELLCANDQVGLLYGDLEKARADAAATAEKLRTLDIESKKTAVAMELAKAKETVELTTEEKEILLRDKRNLERTIAFQVEDFKHCTAQHKEQTEKIERLSEELSQKTALQHQLIQANKKLESQVTHYKTEASKQRKNADDTNSVIDWACKVDAHVKSTINYLKGRYGTFCESSH